MTDTKPVDYQTHPSRYKHWKLSFQGPVATLAADFDENAGLRPGYKLKLNSYDLGVDIELNDAVSRIQPRLEGQLLQVHERDPQRTGGFVQIQWSEIPGSRQWRLRRWWL